MLLVDDDPVLTEEGYAASVLRAVTTEAIRTAVDRLEPDCLLLDGRDGLDYDAQGRPVGVELLSPQAIGVDVGDLPVPDRLIGLLAHLGIRATASGASQTDPAVLG